MNDEFTRIIILKIHGDSKEQILEKTRRLMMSEIFYDVDVTLGQIKQTDSQTVKS